VIEWFKARFREPTTWGGLSMFILSIGQLAKINEAPAIAHTIDAVAGPITSGDYATALTVALGGVLSIVLREKGK
tara:strand:- start:1156 stop:1380 length:225 start_codon:yes stop_codon:yes gene_type:complete